MDAGEGLGAADIDQPDPVEVQDVDRGPPDLRQTRDHQEITAPGEVITPAILAGMK
jgi:hypothetical protein